MSADGSPRIRSVDEVLDEARTRLIRLPPPEALAAQAAGGLIVDIRPDVNRRAEGEIPGALVVDRNVLEWRLDPRCEARLPLASYDLHVILVCNEGYASSLAALSLQELGISAATDVIGGFRAWRAAGLPVARGG